MMDPMTFLAALACAATGAAVDRGAQKLARARRVRRIVKAAEAVASMPPVRNDQVLKFALPGHRPCNGKGIVGWSKPEAQRSLCECAQKRFMAAHKEHVTTIGNGAMVWMRKPEAA